MFEAVLNIVEAIMLVEVKAGRAGCTSGVGEDLKALRVDILDGETKNED